MNLLIALLTVVLLVFVSAVLGYDSYWLKLAIIVMVSTVYHFVRKKIKKS